MMFRRQFSFCCIVLVSAVGFRSAAGYDYGPPIQPAFCLGSDRFLHSDSIYDATLSPNGKELFTISSHGIYRWDLKSGDKHQVATGCNERSFLCMHPNGKQLITVANRGVAVFDAATGKLTVNAERSAIGGEIAPMTQCARCLH